MNGLLLLDSSNVKPKIQGIMLILNRSIVTVLVTAVMVGQVVSLSPDYKKAKQAADRIFHLLESVPHIDCYSDAGKQPVRDI